MSLRQKAAPQDSGLIQKVLADYVVATPLPFDFGQYNFLKGPKAASGLGLLHCSGFAKKWLNAFPSCQIASQLQFTRILDSLIVSGCMGRFPPGHGVWENLNILDCQQRKTWTDRQYAKAQVVLYHLRRVKNNPVKKAQAWRGLPEHSKKLLDALLSKVTLPIVRTGSSSSATSTSTSSTKKRGSQRGETQRVLQNPQRKTHQWNASAETPILTLAFFKNLAKNSSSSKKKKSSWQGMLWGLVYLQNPRK